MSHSWPMAPLGQVLTERQEAPSPDGLARGEIPIVAKIAFDDGQIQLRSEAATKTGMILIRPGDLVISGINAAKGAIAMYDESATSPIAATIHYGAYIPNKNKVDIRYLWWLLRSGTFRDLLFQYVPGGIKTELKAKRFLPIPVPLPSLPEPRRIVARIDELAAKIAQARHLRQLAEEEADALVSSFITGALGGIRIDGCLGDVLLEKPRNGWSARCDNSDTAVPVLSLGAITGFRYRETEFKRTSEPTSSEAHYWLQPGDLLITRSNTPELVGHAAIYSGTPSPCVYPDLMMRLSVDESRADKQFVHCWLRSRTVREHITRLAKGTSPTMKKISQEVVMKIPFPANLSLSLQQRAVAYLQDVEENVDSVKRCQTETAAELDAMLPSILDKAFRGEL